MPNMSTLQLLASKVIGKRVIVVLYYSYELLTILWIAFFFGSATSKFRLSLAPSLVNVTGEMREIFFKFHLEDKVNEAYA